MPPREDQVFSWDFFPFELSTTEGYGPETQTLNLVSGRQTGLGRLYDPQGQSALGSLGDQAEVKGKGCGVHEDMRVATGGLCCLNK